MWEDNVFDSTGIPIAFTEYMKVCNVSWQSVPIECFYDTYCFNTDFVAWGDADAILVCRKRCSSYENALTSGSDIITSLWKKGHFKLVPLPQHPDTSPQTLKAWTLLWWQLSLQRSTTSFHIPYHLQARTALPNNDLVHHANHMFSSHPQTDCQIPGWLLHTSPLVPPPPHLAQWIRTARMTHRGYLVQTHMKFSSREPCQGDYVRHMLLV